MLYTKCVKAMKPLVMTLGSKPTHALLHFAPENVTALHTTTTHAITSSLRFYLCLAVRKDQVSFLEECSEVLLFDEPGVDRFPFLAWILESDLVVSC